MFRFLSLKFLFILFIAVFLLVLLDNAVYAHKVNVYAYAEGKTVHIMAYFRSGVNAQNALVKVFTQKGEKIKELKTDKEGLASFVAPFRTNYRITVNAGEGHINEYLLKADELPSDLPLESQIGLMPPASSPVATVHQATKEQKLAAPVKYDLPQLETIINAALERKLAPLRKMLLEIKQEQQDKMEKVVAGIGIIFGFCGIYFYLRVKRKEN